MIFRVATGAGCCMQPQSQSEVPPGDVHVGEVPGPSDSYVILRVYLMETKSSFVHFAQFQIFQIK